MTKYAYFDSSQPNGSYVLGWYDTELHDYKLPDRKDLLTLTDEQWESRLENPSQWMVIDGELRKADKPRSAARN